MKYLLAILFAVSPSVSYAAVTDYWKLDDNAASTTVVATTGDNGTLEGGDNTSVKQTGAGPGDLAYSFDMNGTDDAINVAASAVPFSNAQAFTFSFWVNADSVTTNPLMGRNAGTVYEVWLQSSTSVRVSTQLATLDFTVPTMSTGTWYHVFVTRDTSNNVRVFLNGTESSTGAQTGGGAMQPNRLARASAVYLDGRLAQVRVFDSDESANVATYYAEGVSAVGPAINPISSSIPGSSLDPIRTTIP